MSVISWPVVSNQFSTNYRNLFTNSRGGRIRTDDLSDPNRALYQAELRPELRNDVVVYCCSHAASTSKRYLLVNVILL